jgi:hypothetical protein
MGCRSRLSGSMRRRVRGLRLGGSCSNWELQACLWRCLGVVWHLPGYASLRHCWARLLRRQSAQLNSCLEKLDALPTACNRASPSAHVIQLVPVLVRPTCLSEQAVAVPNVSEIAVAPDDRAALLMMNGTVAEIGPGAIAVPPALTQAPGLVGGFGASGWAGGWDHRPRHGGLPCE